MRDGSWCINIPTSYPLVRHSRGVPQSLSESPQQDQAPLTTVVTCLLMVFLPFRLTALLFTQLPGINSEVSHLCPNSCLSVSSSGQTEIHNASTLCKGSFFPHPPTRSLYSVTCSFFTLFFCITALFTVYN